jgi:hypothetical protein
VAARARQEKSWNLFSRPRDDGKRRFPRPSRSPTTGNRHDILVSDALYAIQRSLETSLADRRCSWLHPPAAFLRDDPGSARACTRRCVPRRVCSLRECTCRDCSRSPADGLCCFAPNSDTPGRPTNQVCAPICGFLPVHATPAGCNCFLLRQFSSNQS